MQTSSDRQIDLSLTNPLLDRLESLKELVPEAFSEGAVDFEKLRAALGDTVDDNPERYNFTWAGKREAIRVLQSPSRATLIPVKRESVDFETTQNIFIEGDNLEALKLLYKPYFGRVKLIYIDPPYNTGNDFIYRDNFTNPLDNYFKLSGQKDSEGNLLTSNPESGGRFHSSWLSMMYPRLFLARQLLCEEGIIFISIDDHENHNLRLLMNEVFGEENFITTIIWQKNFSPKNTARHFSEDHDYILVYAKDASLWLPRLLPRSEVTDARYQSPDNDPRGVWSSSDLTARNYYSEGQYEVTSPGGKKFRPTIGTYWRVKYDKFLALDKDKRIWWGQDGNNMPRLKRFLSEVKQGIVPQTLWLHNDVGHTQEAKKELLEYVHFEHTENVLNTIKPTRLLRKILQIATSPTDSDIVMDFFSGSASTGHAIFTQNLDDNGKRKFILVQFPEPLPIPETSLKTIADIGKERLRHVAERMHKGHEGKLALESANDLGFKVFKLATSNFRHWSGDNVEDAQTFSDQMELFTDPLIKDWKEENVIYEIALKEGLGLNIRIEKSMVNTVFQVKDHETGQSFYITLDKVMHLGDLRPLNLKPDDLFVCRDIALDDETAANLALQCRLKTI